MQLDQNPFFRKTITPWYDSNFTCWALIWAMGVVFCFAVGGIIVASNDPRFFSAYLVSRHALRFVRIPGDQNLVSDPGPGQKRLASPVHYFNKMVKYLGGHSPDYHIFIGIGQFHDTGRAACIAFFHVEHLPDGQREF